MRARVVGHHPTAYNYLDPKGLGLLGEGLTANAGNVFMLYVCVLKITNQMYN